MLRYIITLKRGRGRIVPFWTLFWAPARPPNVEEGLDAFGVLGGLGRRVSREWWFREVQVSTILSGSEVNRGLENGWLEAVRCFTDLS